MAKETPPTPAVPPAPAVVGADAHKADLINTAQFLRELILEGEPSPAKRSALALVAQANLDKLLKAAGAI